MWRFDETKIDEDSPLQENVGPNNFGSKERPLNISQLGVPLADLKLLSMLLDDDQHENVQSLTEEKVGELDTTAEKLQLSVRNWVYFARSRLNN